MRIRIAFPLCTLLTVLCCTFGCNSDSAKNPADTAASSDKSSNQSANSGDGDKHFIAFVTNQVASFWNIAKVGCMDAAEDLGVKVDVRFPPEFTATKQKQIVEDLLSSGIDAMAISPIDAVNQQEMVNEWAAKIPLLTHDSDAPNTNRLMFIGPDNYLAGRTLGKLIKDVFPDGAKMVITVGRLEQDNARKRRQGVIDELLDRDHDDKRFDPVDGELKNDRYTIYATLTDQGKAEVAKQKAEDALNTFGDMDLFVGLFVYNPPACLQAIRQAQMEDRVRIAAFDEDDVTLQGIKDGPVIGTVVQNPYEYGYQSVKYLKDILDGNTSVIPDSKFLDVPTRCVTKDGRDIGGTKSENVDDFWTDLKAKIGGAQ